MELAGKHIAILAADLYEDNELLVSQDPPYRGRGRGEDRRRESRRHL